MERLVLTARVAWENGCYVARVEKLDLEGTGDSVRQAQDELIDALRSWIEMQDALSLLERTLAQAGFPGVSEETELQLEFEVSQEDEAGPTG